MEQLIVLGNGFDLQSNLKSSVSDFMSSEHEATNNFWHILIQQAIDNDISGQNWFDIEALVEKVLVELEPYILQELLHQYFHSKEQSPEPLRYNQLFTNQQNIFNDQWRSIESMIERSPYDTEMQDLFRTVGTMILETQPKETSELYKLMVTGDLYLEKDSFTGNDWFENFLLEQLNQFEHSFTQYLLKTTEENEEYLESAHVLIHKLRGAFGNNVKPFILSFNYTTPFSRPDFGQPYVITNVHGTLIKDNIIFGIDSLGDIEEGLKTRMVRFTKTYRKMFLMDSNSWGLPNNPYEIIFYGHSLSMADFSYFQSIFDHVDLYHSNVKLKFIYSSYNDGPTKNERESEEVARVHRLINRYGSSISNTTQGENLLHKLLLENRIHMRYLS